MGKISSWLRRPAVGKSHFVFFLPASALAYVLCFIAPLGVVLYWAGVFSSVGSAEFENVPVSIEIGAEGSFLRVKDSTELVPSDGDDLVVATWFKLGRVPASGQQLILFSRYETVEGSPAAGYAFALRREGPALRPLVYWGSGKRRGKWYEFPEMRIPAKKWFMASLSLRELRYLGAYLGIEGSSELQVLGGYDLGEEASDPVGQADLLSGAFGDRHFRGSIGPLLVVVRRGMGEQFGDIINGFFSNPGAIPADVPEKNVRLFLLGSSDRSPSKRPIEFGK